MQIANDVRKILPNSALRAVYTRRHRERIPFGELSIRDELQGVIAGMSTYRSGVRAAESSAGVLSGQNKYPLMQEAEVGGVF